MTYSREGTGGSGTQSQRPDVAGRAERRELAVSGAFLPRNKLGQPGHSVWTDHCKWPLACSCSSLTSTFEYGVTRRTRGQAAGPPASPVPEPAHTPTLSEHSELRP